MLCRPVRATPDAHPDTPKRPIPPLHSTWPTNSPFSCRPNRTQAVGAADKVFELINREPKGATPTGATYSAEIGMRSGPDAIAAAEAAAAGEKPGSCLGTVELRNVDFEYPSR